MSLLGFEPNNKVCVYDIRLLEKYAYEFFTISKVCIWVLYKITEVCIYCFTVSDLSEVCSHIFQIVHMSCLQFQMCALCILGFMCVHFVFSILQMCAWKWLEDGVTKFSSPRTVKPLLMYPIYFAWNWNGSKDMNMMNSSLNVLIRELLQNGCTCTPSNLCPENHFIIFSHCISVTTFQLIVFSTVIFCCCSL